MMIRISVLSMMFALAMGAAGAQQLPPQPPPVASLMERGNDQERAACHPDVSRFCALLCATTTAKRSPMSISRRSRATIGSQVAQQGRGAKDCGEHRQAAGAFASVVG
jgi:hypothetical protein